jgi:hypothetical protein
MNDPTDPDLVFDLDTVRLVAASAPEPVGAMLTSMADALESLRERYRMAEVIADIARMKVRADDTPVPLKDGDKMPMILSWVCRTLAACLEAKGAPNYFGWGWTDEETGKSYRVRVQHDTGKSPECVAAEARDERDTARRDLAEALATLANERGQGEPPSPGCSWQMDEWGEMSWSHEDGEWSIQPADADENTPDGGWFVMYGGSNMDTGAPGTAPTAREAMRAANAARGAT